MKEKQEDTDKITQKLEITSIKTAAEKKTTATKATKTESKEKVAK